MHPIKASVNTIMTGVGIWGGPPGWIISSIYFINDAMTPSGNTVPKLLMTPFKAVRDNTNVKIKFP